MKYLAFSLSYIYEEIIKLSQISERRELQMLKKFLDVVLGISLMLGFISIHVKAADAEPP